MSKQLRQDLERRCLSIAEAAESSSLSPATIYRLVGNGTLATIKIGARRLVPVSGLDALLSMGASK
jgi:excisionase family DNA binding protein